MKQSINKKQFKSIEEYISSFPIEIQYFLQELREIIKKSAPMAKETINYNIPTYILNGNLVHFAGYKNHIGFYPTPSGIKQYKNELSTYETSKGAIRFSIEKPLPKILISKIVRFRVKENLLKER